MEDCNFTRNSGGEGSFGGGIQVPLLIQNLGRPPCNLEFIRCVFDMNVADYGGGLSTVQVRCHKLSILFTVAVFVSERLIDRWHALCYTTIYACIHNMQFHVHT